MILAFALHNKNRYDNKYRLSSLWVLVASLPGLLFTTCNAKLLYILNIKYVGSKEVYTVFSMFLIVLFKFCLI